MLPGVTDTSELHAVADRIRHRMATTTITVTSASTGERTTIRPVTVSIGGAVYPETAGTAGRLIFEADATLLEAKRGGRNRVDMAVTTADPRARPELAGDPPIATAVLRSLCEVWVWAPHLNGAERGPGQYVADDHVVGGERSR
jgi:diguanylate cyclase with GGDEF domain